MAHIGVFTATANGYSGRLKTLTLDVELTLVPADAGDAENAPRLSDLPWFGAPMAQRSAQAGSAPARKRATISRC